MIVATRHRPADPDEFLASADGLLQVLGGRPGFVSGHLGRSPDDPGLWLLLTVWQDVGSMRRGLGSFEAKVALAPVMLSAADEPSAFEELVRAGGDGVHRAASARAPDRPGR